MALEYNGLVMANGTEYRVLVDYQPLVEMVNCALQSGELLTVPMGMYRPGKPEVVNPLQIVTINKYKDS